MIVADEEYQERLEIADDEPDIFFLIHWGEI